MAALRGLVLVARLVPFKKCYPANRAAHCRAFFHHYHGSIDFNIVNIHPTVFLDRISIKKGNHAFAAETGPSCQSRVSPNVWLK